MARVERVPKIVAGITLVAGVVLLAKPEVFTRPTGLDDETLGVRLVGVADLVLVPGLAGLTETSPSSWMAARAVTSAAQGAYLASVASKADKQPAAVKASALTLFGLAVADTVTAIQLRRASR